MLRQDLHADLRNNRVLHGRYVTKILFCWIVPTFRLWFELFK